MSPMKFKTGITALVLTAVICCVLCPSCSKQSAAMTYGKTEITEGMYSYWLSVYKTTFIFYGLSFIIRQILYTPTETEKTAPNSGKKLSLTELHTPAMLMNRFSGR